jgi:hypothetical protein
MLRIEIHRDRERKPGEGIPKCWSMLALMSAQERELFEPPPRPVLPEGYRDPFEIPPRFE